MGKLHQAQLDWAERKLFDNSATDPLININAPDNATLTIPGFDSGTVGNIGNNQTMGVNEINSTNLSNTTGTAPARIVAHVETPRTASGVNDTPTLKVADGATLDIRGTSDKSVIFEGPT